jgi:putative ABC transport system substrate-binding protein
MKRRNVITLLAGAAAWPFKARAQQRDRTRRVAVLMGPAASDVSGQVLARELQNGLDRLGWIEGRNLQLEYRWTNGQPDLTRKYAGELVEMQPDVIVPHGTPALIAVRKETRTVPVVFVMVSDPIGMGHVESMSRPGGNVTGFTPFEPSLGGKWVELLKEIAPLATRAALVFNPDTAANALAFVQSAEVGGRSWGVSVTTAPVRSDIEVESVLSDFAQQPANGIILVPDPFTFSRIDLLVAATARHSLPLITPFREYTARGAVLSYGVNQADEFRRTAGYIDRVLRGEKPADLPVQAPTKFALTVNLKTAKTLGLDVPATLLARADEVIE